MGLTIIDSRRGRQRDNRKIETIYVFDVSEFIINGKKGNELTDFESTRKR